MLWPPSGLKKSWQIKQTRKRIAYFLRLSRQKYFFVRVLQLNYTSKILYSPATPQIIKNSYRRDPVCFVPVDLLLPLAFRRRRSLQRTVEGRAFGSLKLDGLYTINGFDFVRWRYQNSPTFLYQAFCEMRQSCEYQQQWRLYKHVFLPGSWKYAFDVSGKWISQCFTSSAASRFALRLSLRCRNLRLTTPSFESS